MLPQNPESTQGFKISLALTSEFSSKYIGTENTGSQNIKAEISISFLPARVNAFMFACNLYTNDFKRLIEDPLMMLV